MEAGNATSLRQTGIAILRSSVTGEADRNTALAIDVITLCSKKNPKVFKNLFVHYFLNPPATRLIMNLLHRSSTLTPTKLPCIHNLTSACVKYTSISGIQRWTTILVIESDQLQQTTNNWISNFPLVLNGVFFHLGDYLASEFYEPTFRNTVPPS